MRVFVLGAGFSKACASLPLAKEMMLLILERARASDERGAEHVLDFFEDVERRFVRENIEDHGHTLVDSNLAADFEFLLTLLSLNSDRPRESNVRDSEGNPSSVSLGRLTAAPYEFADMFIEDVIYDVLWETCQPNELLPRFVQSTAPGDVIITFNYDLVLDRSLYDAGLWNPKDGYELERTQPVPSIADVNRPPSRIRIIKLHGSLNWDIGSGNDAVRIHGYHDPSVTYFPGWAMPPQDKWETRAGYKRGFGILPSFIKSYKNASVLQLWKRSHQHLSAADEIVVIGYSLNDADSAAWILFGTAVGDRIPITVYDTREGVDDVRSRFGRAAGREVQAKAGGLEEYLSDSGV